eukprot:m.306259 g.306259  ORF g.306259 m.306259 type:complete len:154 (-) comp18749_c0_seq1:41-502(-)
MAAAPAQARSFGPFVIEATEIFLRSATCFCFVNLKPVVPGHVLIASNRVVPRFADLEPDEVADLFQTAQRVARTLEPRYGATSMTIALQDGPEAGQTVPHVHVHVLPRKARDFPDNDDVYSELAQHDKPGVREPRPRAVMSAEAAELRKLFEQ